MPHSRCNCRCVMCDIWKANHNKQEISVIELQKHVGQFKQLGVKEVVFSGGEALMHTNLWGLTKLLRDENMELTLLSTGLLIETHAEQIVRDFRDVILSIDGSQPVHDRIRNVPRGFEKITSGIKALKTLQPSFRTTARCVLQKQNFTDLVNIVRATEAIGIDQVSFLAADVSSTAFNHGNNLGQTANEVILNLDECLAFEEIVENSFTLLKNAYESRFIAESPGKMRKLVQYYKAINGLDAFPHVACNAPWVSAVLESDGRVMPCFFHEPYGNIYEQGFLETINSPKAILFRKDLVVSKNAVCQRCVCSLNRRLRIG
ncbi:MAG TPA: radical SAM protein [Chryseolinea sp.]|nr:radical SAM protein [Chryseolinea sp.]